MIQEISVYEQRVKQEANSLKGRSGRAIDHGSEGWCPNCGHLGVFDLQGTGLAAASIFFSVAREKWCCMVCEIETFGY